MTRYQNLFDALNVIRQRRTKLRMVEVGTYDGVRASQLLQTWLSFDAKFTAEYYGFDLFEDMTKELTKAELSKTRLPPSAVEARKRIIAAVGTRAEVVLNKGNTRETLHAICPTLGTVDLVFIDGGHSLETISSDWAAVKQLMDKDTIVLFDDYYDNRSDFGCAHEVGLIADEPAHPIIGNAKFVPKYNVERLEPLDSYEHTQLDVRMVKVTLAK